VGSIEFPVFDAPALTELGRPFGEATVGLLVTCGAYYRTTRGQHNDCLPAAAT